MNLFGLFQIVLIVRCLRKASSIGLRAGERGERGWYVVVCEKRNGATNTDKGEKGVDALWFVRTEMEQQITTGWRGGGERDEGVVKLFSCIGWRIKWCKSPNGRCFNPRNAKSSRWSLFLFFSKKRQRARRTFTSEVIHCTLSFAGWSTTRDSLRGNIIDVRGAKRKSCDGNLHKKKTQANTTPHDIQYSNQCSHSMRLYYYGANMHALPNKKIYSSW